ncbi:MAG: LamG-like jellyroll fold domain-containing protein, partial [Alphaproteobacteria bacterium]
TAIPLDISVTGIQDGDAAEVSIQNIPDGATLTNSAGDTITVTDGTATLTPDQLDGLAITPPANADDDFNLTVAVTTTDAESGDTATVTDTLAVSVDAVADAATNVTVTVGEPQLGTPDDAGAGQSLASDDFASGVSGWGGDAVASGGQLAIGQDKAVTKTFDFGADHAGETVTISFDAATFGGWDSSGSYVDYFSVTVNDTQLLNTATSINDTHSFEVTLDENGQISVNLAVDATAGDEGVNIDNFTVTSGDDWSGSTPSTLSYDLDISAQLPDAGETLSVELSGLPDGATLTAGGQTITISGGTASLTADQLDGIVLTLPVDADNFTLTTTAITAEANGDTATTVVTSAIEVPDIADAPTLEVSNATGTEDTSIALDIDAALTDVSETLSIEISGIPDGATLTNSAGDTITITDGSASLTADQLNGLAITPPSNSDADFDLTVTATSTEGSASASETATLSVTVSGVADAPALSVNLGAGTSVELTEGSSSTTTVFTSNFGSDDGWYDTLDGWSTNSDKIEAWESASGHTGDGVFVELNDDSTDTYDDATSIDRDFNTVEGATYTLTFAYSPRPGFDADANQFSVKVDGATIQTYSPDGTNNSDNEWSTATITFTGTGSPMNLEFIATGEAQQYGRGVRLDDISVTETVTEPGDMGTSYPLDISAALTDTDGSESLSITIGDLPADAVLTNAAGDTITISGNSTTLTSDQLEGLTITVPEATDNFDLSVTATSSEGGTTATTSTTVSLITGDGGVLTGTESGDVIHGSAGSEGSGLSPVFHFELEDTTWSSNETVTDTITGMTGTSKGGTGTTSSGAEGKAAQMDGSGDYIEVPHNSAMELSSGTFSIDFKAWNNGTIASKDSSGYDDGGHFNLDLNSNHQLELRVQTESESFYITSDTVAWDSWVNATVTWDGENVTLYVNGEEAGSVATSYTMENNENPWTFGATQMYSGDNVATNLSDYFDGQIDNPTLIDGAMTPAQVSEMVSSGVNSYVENNLVDQPVSASGDDVISGGAGDDLIYSEGGSDTIDGGTGNDTIDLTHTDNATPGVAPVSFWKFEETSGSTIADTVGDNDGSVNSDTVLDFTGTSGSGASFDGNNDYVTVGHDSSMELANGSLTLSFKSTQQDDTLVSKGKDGQDPGEFELKVRDEGTIKLEYTDENGDKVSIEGGNVTWGEWNTVTMTWGDDGLQLYVNGDLAASDSSVTNGIDGNTADLRFAAKEDGGDEFEGALDEIALFDKQLSVDEINTIETEGVQSLVDGSEGTYGSSIVDGGEGDDTIVGGAGADTLDGGDGEDTLDYSNSDEAVMIDFENGTVSGGDAEGDHIANFENAVGSDFDDTIIGNSGSNRLDGGKGSDELTGGDGADVFVLGGVGDGVDIITDFNAAEGDQLDISSVVNMDDVDQLQNYLKLEEDENGNTTVKVNESGDGNEENFAAVATIEGVTGLDINSIIQDQNGGGEGNV